YQEQKERVDKLKDKLAQNDPQKYGKLAARNIAERISAAGTLILDQETQEKIENLKNGKVADASQVRKTEEEVIHQVNLAIAKKKLSELLAEIKKLGKNKKAKEKGSDLFKYISDANTYHQQAYQINKSQVDEILVEQGFIQSSNKTNSPFGGFFQPKVLIPVAIAVGVVVTFLVIMRNNKQRKIKGF
ncbi:2054_t:CDS:1, partial [Ambispora gerdemannii]